MPSARLDSRVRLAAFAYLDELNSIHGEELPRDALARGFTFEGERVPLLGPQGIFKPRVLPEMPLSVTTAPPVEGKPRPCDDEFEGEDLILKIEIREDLPREKDGPMLIHGMQGFQGRRIHVPGARSFRPAEELLEERYERFRRAV